jgi:hypothetical protein
LGGLKADVFGGGSPWIGSRGSRTRFTDLGDDDARFGLAGIV